jgi:small-conductance mechanosensitive channel
MQSTAKAGFVQTVDLLTTTFRQATGEVFVMANAELARVRIYNMRRTGSAVIVLRFVVGFDTSWAAIDRLKEFISNYTDKHPNTWKPGVDLYVEALERTESLYLVV